MGVLLIADSGSTKAEWCLLDGNKKKRVITTGLSPYFVSGQQMQQVFKEVLYPKISQQLPDEIFFYGAGCSNPQNLKTIKDEPSSFI